MTLVELVLEHSRIVRRAVAEWLNSGIFARDITVSDYVLPCLLRIFAAKW